MSGSPTCRLHAEQVAISRSRWSPERLRPTTWCTTVAGPVQVSGMARLHCPRYSLLSLFSSSTDARRRSHALLPPGAPAACHPLLTSPA